MSTRISVPSVKGLIPALDRKQIAAPSVLEGTNFVFDAEGPYSAFGSTILTRELITEYVGSETFRVGEDVWIFTNEGIFAFDHDSDSFYPIFLFTTALTTVFPWSTALVGGYYYFGKKGLNGVLQYDPLTEEWLLNTVNIPTGACAVAQSMGRLVVLGTEVVAWSEIDNGTEAGMLPSTTTGAGFQLLAIIGYGDPLGVFAAADGFLSYTTKGILKSEFIDSANPFRHYPLSQRPARPNELIPISPYCIVEIGQNTHVFLSQRGFFVTSGQIPQPWQPIFGEYIVRKILPVFDFTNPLLMRLSFNSLRSWFFVSLSEGETELYNKAFVLYLPRDEWGVFNRTHAALGEFHFGTGPNFGFGYGYICDNGRVHFFNDNPVVETQTPMAVDYYWVRPALEYPARFQNGAIIFPSVMRFRTIDESLFPAVPELYSIDVNTQEVALVQGTYADMDSYIDVGLFRLVSEQQITMQSEIIELLVGMLEAPQTDFTFEDWLAAMDSAEDWLTASGDEDWGFNIVSSTEWDMEIIGTYDGYAVFEDNQYELDPVYINGRMRFYAPECGGLFHIVRFKAQEEGKSFHLKFLELNGIVTGVSGVT